MVITISNEDSVGSVPGYTLRRIESASRKIAVLFPNLATSDNVKNFSLSIADYDSVICGIRNSKTIAYKRILLSTSCCKLLAAQRFQEHCCFFYVQQIKANQSFHCASQPHSVISTDKILKAFSYSF